MRKTEHTQQAVAGPLLVDEDKAAAMLSVSPRTLQRWRLVGRGPAFCRIGGRRLYRIADLEAFILASVVQRRAA